MCPPVTEPHYTLYTHNQHTHRMVITKVADDNRLTSLTLGGCHNWLIEIDGDVSIESELLMIIKPVSVFWLT